MKRALLPSIAFIAVAAIGLAFVHPFGDPRIEPAKGLDTLLKSAVMPAEAKKILVAKCADCHSNETRWPLYARLAPGSWLIERDIMVARGKMNLSTWDSISTDSKQVLAGKIVHEAKTGEMSPLQYRLLHWRAKLTPADVATLSLLNTASEQTSGQPGDAAHGEQLFQRRCTGCHAMDSDREGPRLAGVFGRRAGSVAGFDYSAGLEHSGVTWDKASLERWLSDPDSVASDNKMDFHVPNAQERSDLIAYLKRSKSLQ